MAFNSATECRLHAFGLGMSAAESDAFVEAHRSPDWMTHRERLWMLRAEFAERFPGAALAAERGRAAMGDAYENELTGTDLDVGPQFGMP